MAPKTKPATKEQSDPHGMFEGMLVFFVSKGVQARRLQIWKQRMVQMGAVIEDRFSKRVTHVFAIDSQTLLHELDTHRLLRFKGRVLRYQWLEESLKLGEKLSEDLYVLNLDPQGEGINELDKSLDPKSTDGSISSEPQKLQNKKIKSSSKDTEIVNLDSNKDRKENAPLSSTSTTSSHSEIENLNNADRRPQHLDAENEAIQEIITTGKLSKLEHFEIDEKVQTISLFGEVWGVGPATALKLYDKGHRTLDDLRNDDSLTNAQKLGLKYFDDIRQRVPRHEVQEMEQILQKVGEDVLPGVIIICGGSYRRGKATCGDIDIIITHPDGTSHKGFLPKFVKCLKDMNFLREDLIFSTHSEEVYPRDIYAFGLVAWTGNDVLNRRLRLQAESKGFRLDDTGLFPAIQGSGGKRGTKGTANMKLYTEREVFDFLGFPWLEPHERNL
ncbi:hypothetical protein KIW84_023335 [Lathyrus oleraceus]|uniref:DNA polymerase n=2 Tax=Pisum sativum TaxID=3888 RepID=A0A9D4YH66_PEA|nr:hypothetical protein KIW84_023335 [Pisum sativum]